MTNVTLGFTGAMAKTRQAPREGRTVRGFGVKQCGPWRTPGRVLWESPVNAFAVTETHAVVARARIPVDAGSFSRKDKEDTFHASFPAFVSSDEQTRARDVRGWGRREDAASPENDRTRTRAKRDGRGDGPRPACGAQQVVCHVTSDGSGERFFAPSFFFVKKILLENAEKIVWPLLGAPPVPVPALSRWRTRRPR